jgi:ubiquitin carboxyl-terminal hydrolase 7
MHRDIDIQLPVDGMRTLRDSFCEFVAVQPLHGNLYPTGRYGLQEVVTGIIFSLLPPVLQLQLKRFKYDPVRNRMVKVGLCSRNRP